MRKKSKHKKIKKYNKFFSYTCAERQNRNFFYKDFSYSKSYNTKFTNSIFYGNVFFKSTMKYCGFNGCKFNFIEFRSSNFRGCRFKGAQFENIIFSNCNLSNANFQGATFKNVYFNNTSLKNVKGIKDTNLFTKLNNNIEFSISQKLIETLNECKTNPYIISSKTIFYTQKVRLSNSQKKAEKLLPKQERKQLQKERQKQLSIKPKPLSLNKINIILLLDNFTEDEIIRGLHLATKSIDKNFSSISYFVPYIEKANNITIRTISK